MRQSSSMMKCSPSISSPLTKYDSHSTSPLNIKSLSNPKSQMRTLSPSFQPRQTSTSSHHRYPPPFTSTSTSLPRRIRIRTISTPAKSPTPSPTIFETLQQGLSHECSKEQPQLVELKATIPDDSTLPVPHKLWAYMQSRMQAVAEKVEKQRVNTCAKQMYAIKEEIYRYREKDQRTIARLQKTIKEKLTQLNHTFAQLKHTPPQQHKNQHIKMISLKKEIPKLEEDLRVAKLELRKIELEWTECLKKMVKEGYYLVNGVTPILQELKDMSVSLNPLHLPDFLDAITKKQLLQHYNTLPCPGVKSTPQREPKNLLQSRGKNIIQINNRQQLSLKKIYATTAEFMQGWVRNSGWKQTKPSPAPLLQRYANSTKPSLDWVGEQLRRVQFLHGDGPLLRKVKAFLLGSKVQTRSQ